MGDSCSIGNRAWGPTRNWPRDEGHAAIHIHPVLANSRAAEAAWRIIAAAWRINLVGVMSRGCWAWGLEGMLHSGYLSETTCPERQ